MNKSLKSSLFAILFAAESYIFSRLTDIDIKASFLGLTLIVLQCIIYYIQDQ